MILFISDLHLRPEQPETTELFLKCLHSSARQCEGLYILGDLFEAWLGDDDRSPDVMRIISGLRELTKEGVDVYFMHGNRDFLIGEEFAAMTGCHLLPDPSRIELYGTATLLMHGDTLCTDDTDYQKFRRLVRSSEWQKNFLAKPLEERRALAQRLRQETQAQARDKPTEIMDVNSSAVEAVMRDYRVTRLIHGHTHRPGVHNFHLDGYAVQRIVLGDWHRQGSLLRIDPYHYQLLNL